MISWIQRYFQKHFRLVFLMVLVAVALPMVVIYSTSGSGWNDRTKVLQRPFFHVDLANPEQARRLSLDADLSANLHPEIYYRLGGQLQRYALQRIAGLALADQLRLPAPTADQLSRYVATIRAFQNQSGQFDPSVYTQFSDQVKAGTLPYKVADVNRVLRDDYRLAELGKVLGGPGYVMPADIKNQLALVDSTWTVQVAALDYAGFKPAINSGEEALKKFHEENSFRYEVPARPRISIVEFKNSEFTPPVAPTEAELRAFYNANISRFPVPAEAGKSDAAAPGAETDNFPKVRAQVEATLRESASRRLASSAANDLSVALFERKLAANSDQLTDFLTAQRRAPVPVPAFDPANPPADKAWLASYTEQLQRLNQGRFFSDPLPTPDGYVILLWQETLPGYKPSFAEVRERVAADYTASEKRRLFIDRGNTLKAQLQAAAKTGNGFADVAAKENLEVKSYANFTLREPPQDMPQPAVSALMRLPAGQVSDLVAAQDKGYFVFAQAKKEPDLTAANPRYAEIQSQYSAFIAASTENSILAEMVDAELKKLGDTDAVP